MKEIFTKLTHAEASRYDRGGPVRSVGVAKNMAENATETLESKVDPVAKAAWDPYIRGEKDPYARSIYMEFARRKMMPPSTDAPEEERNRRVAEMTKEQLDEEFKKVTGGLKKLEKDPQPLEKTVDEYVANLKRELKGKSIPPGEILIKREDHWVNEDLVAKEKRGERVTVKDWINGISEEADWSKFGWSNSQIKRVAHKLHDELVINGEPTLDFGQIRTTLELLVATGQKPDALLEKIDRQKLKAYREREDVREAIRSHRLSHESGEKLANMLYLGVKQEHIERFIYPTDFFEHNESIYQGTDPSNIEAMAWQIMHHYGMSQWGPRGDFPLLEMRFDKDAAGGGKGKYYVNQANMTRWIRDRMWTIYDVSPDSPLDLFRGISIEKSYRPLELVTMFLTPGRYFNSEDGKTMYDELGIQWITEAWSVGTLRTWDVKYKQAMGDPDNLLKTMQEIFAGNDLTKGAFRKNLFSLMAKMPLNPEGVENGLPRSDNIMGACWNDMFLAYYNLSDFEELQRIWGKGSSFFTREGFLDAFKHKVIRDKVSDASGEDLVRGLGGPELHEAFEKAYDKDTGEIKNKDSFIKLISNFLAVKMNNANLEETLREMMRRAAAEKYGKLVDDKNEKMIDPNDPERKRKIPVKKYALVTNQGKEDLRSLQIAEIIAFSMVRVFGGGARNDPTATGYDNFTKLHYLQTYRDKSIRKNGDAGGNRYTVPQFKMIGVTAAEAIVTGGQKVRLDAFGNVMRDKDGKVVLQQKTILEVMKEMHELTTAYTMKLKQLEKERDGMQAGSEREAKDKEINIFKRNMDQKVQNKVGEFEFKQLAFSNYYDDHIMRAKKTFDLVMKASEIEMEKYVSFDAWGGVDFNREKFQEDVQEKVLHQIRYFLNTYPDLNYNMVIRALDQTATMRNSYKKPPEGPVFRNMTLGEAMFGHELLNREAFWLTDPKTGKPINMRDEKGRKLKGLYEIDYNKVNDNKVLLWKQWFMTKLVADLWSHRAYHSTDPSFDLNYYNNVIKAIESIPGEFMSDEYSLRQFAVQESFFDKKDMAWFKKNAKIENYDLFLRAFFKDILLPDEKEEGIGILLAMSLFTRSIIRQGS